jgi:hypothetical protein
LPANTLPRISAPPSAPEAFYSGVLDALKQSGVPFMIGGGYAMQVYAGIVRDTKDLDIFCTAGDFPHLLRTLTDAGYETEITDATWLGKAREGEHFVDLIFSSANRTAPVDSVWLERSRKVSMFGRSVLLAPPEELIWSKSTVQDRFRFDGSDIIHMMRETGSELDWKHLLDRMGSNWEVLLAHIMMFRFVYPSERDTVPRWLLDEMLERVQDQLSLPTPQDRICRGPLLSRTQYEPDTEEWGYIYK